jgi:hypothetical protein
MGDHAAGVKARGGKYPLKFLSCVSPIVSKILIKSAVDGGIAWNEKNEAPTRF